MNKLSKICNIDFCNSIVHKTKRICIESEFEYQHHNKYENAIRSEPRR